MVEILYSCMNLARNALCRKDNGGGARQGETMDVAAIIRDFLAEPAMNRQGPECDEPCFGEPLVGVAAGDDPLWDFLKAA